MIINPCKKVIGEIRIPGDKSISHRAVIISSISNGKTEIDNFLTCDDCISTINCFKQLGIDVEFSNNKLNVFGKGLYGLKQSYQIIDVKNSGTTARLITGILSAQKFISTITSDKSLRNRPMDRVVCPLSSMGANIEYLSNKNYLPIMITGKTLSGVQYFSKTPSAQIKSSVLLAALYANSKTIYIESALSRNHTELMLEQFGADISTKNLAVRVVPTKGLNPQHISIPGDISSASFFIILALLLPNSELTIKEVGINPTRTGIIDILKKMNAKIAIENVKYFNNEPVADITVYSSNLTGVTIEGDIIPRLIDEIPIIAVAASSAVGKTIIKNADELKIKESNRINAIVFELQKMGSNITKTNDGMIISGPCNLKGSHLNSHNDHRIAMALSIAAKVASNSSIIDNPNCVKISFPDFYEILNEVCL